MERPSKRPRLTENADTEDFDLGEARAHNNLKLKSRFESIFEKYGKDFSSMGDEIDLKTGAIIVDNGHLQEMQNEQDIGRGADDPEPDDSGSPGEQEDSSRAINDEEPSLPPNELHIEHSDPQASDSEADDPLSSHSQVNPAQETAVNLENKASQSNHEFPENSGPPERYGGNSVIQETPSTNNNVHNILPAEPLWQTPDIEGLLPNRVSKSAPIYTPPDRAMSVSPSNGKSLWAGPWTRVPRKDKGIKKGQKRPPSNQPRRKLFSTPELQALRKFKFASVGAESDDSDDPLQDDSYQTPTKRPSIEKRTNGSNTPDGCNNDGKKICNFCKEYFSELQLGHHLDEILSNGKYDGIHGLEEIRKLRGILPEPTRIESSEICNGGSPLISSEMKVSAPVTVSKTPTPQRLPPHQRTMPSPKTSPVQLDENDNAQGHPDGEGDFNDFDPLADDDRFSTTSGLSSIQIKPSPAKSPRKQQGISSPLAMRSSAKKCESEGRFGLFSKRPIKVPIFRTNR